MRSRPVGRAVACNVGESSGASLDDCKAQGHTITTWGDATATQSDAQLLETFVGMLGRRLGEYHVKHTAAITLDSGFGNAGASSVRFALVVIRSP